jgi:hypothetical protein
VASTRTISTPEPKHRCTLPGHLRGMPSSSYDNHYEPVGTIIECEECGARYISEPWPEPGYNRGQHIVGNRWVRIRKLIRWWWRRG